MDEATAAGTGREPVEAYLDRLQKRLGGMPQVDRMRIRGELRAHLQELVAAASGDVEAALARFGDPVEIGRSLARQHRVGMRRQRYRESLPRLRAGAFKLASRSMCGLLMALTPKPDRTYWRDYLRDLGCKDMTQFLERLGKIMRETPREEFTQWFQSKLTVATVGGPDAPINRILSTVMLYALADNATEIRIVPHIATPGGARADSTAPGEVQLGIAYRIDGAEVEQMQLPLYCHGPLLECLLARGSHWFSGSSERPSEGVLSMEADSAASSIGNGLSGRVEELYESSWRGARWEIAFRMSATEWGEEVTLFLRGVRETVPAERVALA